MSIIKNNLIIAIFETKNKMVFSQRFFLAPKGIFLTFVSGSQFSHSANQKSGSLKPSLTSSARKKN